MNMHENFQPISESAEIPVEGSGWQAKFLESIKNEFADNDERGRFRGYLDKYDVRSEKEANEFLNAYQYGDKFFQAYLDARAKGEEFIVPVMSLISGMDADNRGETWDPFKEQARIKAQREAEQAAKEQEGKILPFTKPGEEKPKPEVDHKTAA